MARSYSVGESFGFVPSEPSPKFGGIYNTEAAEEVLGNWMGRVKVEADGEYTKIPMSPEVKEVLDNLEAFKSPSKNDMLRAAERASRDDPSLAPLIEKHKAGEISLKELADKAKRSSGGYTYEYELKNIRYLRMNAYKTIMRMMGQMRRISDGDKRRENTAAEREYRDTEFRG